MKTPSVTEVIGLLAIHALPWAAARETAEYAVRHRSEWEYLGDELAVERIRRHFRGIWDHRAATGSALHDVNDRWARGETVDLGELVELHRGKLPGDEILDELEVMVDVLESAWDTLTPTTISSEEVVRYTKAKEHVYVGQQDWRCTVRGRDWLVDLKTTGRLDTDRALYYDTWRLQLAAYRYCDQAVDYAEKVHRPYRHGIAEVGTRKLPAVHGCAILQVRPNGWQFIPVQAAGTEHNRFLALRQVWGWLQGADRSGCNESIIDASEANQPVAGMA